MLGKLNSRNLDDWRWIMSDGYDVGVGLSRAADPEVAAREATGAARAGRTPTADDLMLLFPTMDYDPVVFFEAARVGAAPAHTVGCSSFASFTGEQQVAKGVVAAFLPAGRRSYGVAAAEVVDHDIFRAARDVTEQAMVQAGGPDGHSALLVFSDGLAGDQREVVRGSYTVTGATVPLFGGAAGENQRAFTTYQYADGQVMRNGLVGIWVNGAEPIGVGVRHGWHPIGEPMIVTRADGNVVYELDGRPAVDMYLANRGNDPLDTDLSGAPTTTFSAQLLDKPLGMATVSGRFDVRHILERTADGGLVMFGHINEQSVVEVMAGDWWDLVDAAEQATIDAIGQLRSPPQGALVFSCTGRVAPLGPRLPDEATAVARGMSGAPVAGFFTYGEFARVTGSTGFHNATVVVLAL